MEKLNRFKAMCVEGPRTSCLLRLCRSSRSLFLTSESEMASMYIKPNCPMSKFTLRLGQSGSVLRAGQGSPHTKHRRKSQWDPNAMADATTVITSMQEAFQQPPKGEFMHKRMLLKAPKEGRYEVVESDPQPSSGCPFPAIRSLQEGSPEDAPNRDSFKCPSLPLLSGSAPASPGGPSEAFDARKIMFPVEEPSPIRKHLGKTSLEVHVSLVCLCPATIPQYNALQRAVLVKPRPLPCQSSHDTPALQPRGVACSRSNPPPPSS